MHNPQHCHKGTSHHQVFFLSHYMLQYFTFFSDTQRACNHLFHWLHATFPPPPIYPTPSQLCHGKLKVWHCTSFAIFNPRRMTTPTRYKRHGTYLRMRTSDCVTRRGFCTLCLIRYGIRINQHLISRIESNRPYTMKSGKNLAQCYYTFM